MPTGRRPSTTWTDAPRRASSYATAHPTIPAPTTTMSDGRGMVANAAIYNSQFTIYKGKTGVSAGAPSLCQKLNCAERDLFRISEGRPHELVSGARGVRL